MTYRFDNDTIRWDPTLKRETAGFQHLPYLLNFPVYLSHTETVILPEGGRGFELEGKSFDRTVAGTQISRTVSLENGRATAKSLFRQLKPEISAEEARASEGALKEINADIAGVRAPESYKAPKSATAAVATAPRTAEEFNERGHDFLQKGELDKAIADFDKAAALSPKWSVPLANRAIVLVHQEKAAEAEETLKKAQTLSDKDAYVHQGYGMLYLLQDKPSEAVKSFSRSLQIEPANAYTLFRRAEAYAQLKRFDDALADIEASLEEDPEHVAALLAKARLAALMDDQEGAIAAIDALVAKDPSYAAYKAYLLKRFGKQEAAAPIFAKLIAETAENSAGASKEERIDKIVVKADLLWDSGQHAAAVRELSAAIAANPKHVGLLNARCWTRATAGIELEQALQDCDLALKKAPDSAPIIDSRAFVLLRMGRIKESIAEFGRALKIAPKLAAALYGRGIAKLRDGNREGGEQDLAAARRIVFDIDSQYAEYGIKP